MSKVKKGLHLTFPQDLIKEPIIYRLSKEFDVVFNLRRAKVTETAGEIVLELECDNEVLEKAVQWLKGKGLKVDPVTRDTMES